MYSFMVELVYGVGVSELIIVCFCCVIGCSGFQDFKLKLVQSLVVGVSFGQFLIYESDLVVDFSLKIFDIMLYSLMEVCEYLDIYVLECVIVVIVYVQCVEFYGFGVFGVVVLDVQYKFFCLLLLVVVYFDLYMQVMLVVIFKFSDVVICIFQLGCLKDLLIIVNLVCEVGVMLIILCLSQILLVDLVMVNLVIDVYEDIDIYILLILCIVYLVVIDVLVMGVVMVCGLDLVNYFKSVKCSLCSLCLLLKVMKNQEECGELF